MRAIRLARGITVVEVLALLVAGAVVLAILVAGVLRMRTRPREASCLDNLQHIAAATLAYAAEDARNQIVPLHRMMVSREMGDGFPEGVLGWRVALPFSFGGQTATVPMPTSKGDATVMTDPAGGWGARTKPLNGYLAGSDSTGLEVFHCPADTGVRETWKTRAPREAANIPCFNFIGNSYSIADNGIVWLSRSCAQCFLTSSPWGHRAESIQSPLHQTVLYCDPFFDAASEKLANEPDTPPLPGWHGELMADNVAYCDGSARRTPIGELRRFTDDELRRMGCTRTFPWQRFLRGGPGWQTDCFPTPGALIRVYSGKRPQLSTDMLDTHSDWPLARCQTN
ncbi:MAG: hypothetical protein PVJ57_09995 [Phycisphaerae bacterium]|jgi:hypothetical protein